MLKLKETINSIGEFTNTIRPRTAIENVIISELYLTGHGYLVNRFTNVWTAWGIIEHRCPKCNKAITNPIDWEFTLVANECIGCNHVGGDLL